MQRWQKSSERICYNGDFEKNARMRYAVFECHYLNSLFFFLTRFYWDGEWYRIGNSSRNNR